GTAGDAVLSQEKGGPVMQSSSGVWLRAYRVHTDRARGAMRHTEQRPESPACLHTARAQRMMQWTSTTTPRGILPPPSPPGERGMAAKRVRKQEGSIMKIRRFAQHAVAGVLVLMSFSSSPVMAQSAHAHAAAA